MSRLIAFLFLLFSVCAASARDMGNLTGVNANFFYSPLGIEHPAVWRRTAELGTRLMRFPGGTVANLYDWKSGTITPKKGNRIPRRVDLDGFFRKVSAEHLRVVYVINIFDPVEKTVELYRKLAKAAYPVAAFELGNEPYMKGWEHRVGGVDAYREKSVQVAAALRKAGCRVPLGIAAMPEWGPEEERAGRWNRALAGRDLSLFQAVTIHYYLQIDELGGFEKTYRLARAGVDGIVDRMQTRFPGKEILSENGGEARSRCERRSSPTRNSSRRSRPAPSR